MYVYGYRVCKKQYQLNILLTLQGVCLSQLEGLMIYFSYFCTEVFYFPRPTSILDNSYFTNCYVLCNRNQIVYVSNIHKGVKEDQLQVKITGTFFMYQTFNTLGVKSSITYFDLIDLSR